MTTTKYLIVIDVIQNVIGENTGLQGEQKLFALLGVVINEKTANNKIITKKKLVMIVVIKYTVKDTPLTEAKFFVFLVSKKCLLKHAPIVKPEEYQPKKMTEQKTEMAIDFAPEV